MFSRVVVLLMTLLLASCDKEEEVPEYLLPKEKIVQVLIRAHLLEAEIELFATKSDSAAEMYDHFDETIYEKVGVDKEEYEKTMKYYVDRPEDLFAIYEVVVDSLTVRTKNRNLY